MDAIIVLLIIVSIVGYLVYTGRNYRSKQREIEQEHVDVRRFLDIIYHNLDKAKEVDEIDSRIEAVNRASRALEGLMLSHPDYANYKSLAEDVDNLKREVNTDSVLLETSFLMDMSKASLDFGLKAEHATKAIALIDNQLKNGPINKTRLTEARQEAVLYAVSTRADALREKAQRFEFKNNFADAIDAYQDLLFLFKDDTSNTIVSPEDIVEIKNKIEALRKAS